MKPTIKQAETKGYHDAWLEAEAYAAKLEANLAKAVEALRFYAWENERRLPSEGPWGAASKDFGRVARTTLAELKGQDDE